MSLVGVRGSGFGFRVARAGPVSGFSFRFSGVGFRVSCFMSGVQGSAFLGFGFEEQTWSVVLGLELGFGVWSLGFGVWGLEFGVWGLGSGVWGLGFT